MTRKLLTLLALFLGSLTARAEDIDIFRALPPVAGMRPNVLILLDNTANWNTAFDAEKSALVSLVNGINSDYNVGLMMFTESGGGNGTPDGAYVRFGVRWMSGANKTNLAGLVGGLHINNDKSNSGKAGVTMAEVYRYFGGLAAYAGHNKVKRDYPGNTSNPYAKDLPGNAFASSAATSYTSPIGNACQRNYLIYISNGPVQDNASDNSTAASLLSAAGGDTSQIALSPSGSQTNVADEWARFLYAGDASPGVSGNQNIVSYTLDVLPGTTGQGPGWTSLLKSMALRGGGRYFSSNGSAADLLAKLQTIFNEIQAIDSVFSSVTLPVSVNVRGTYLNQVYMGVFRPDPDALPRWYGNLKLYQLGYDAATGDAFLADSLGKKAESQASGFILPDAVSFWTSASNFWDFSPSGTPQTGSDSPDGAVVEKGGSAQKQRTAYATSQAARKVYTCTGSCAAGSNLTGFAFSTANASITQALLGAASSAERDALINWARGTDNLDENGNATTTDVRASIHGDVLHSRPVIVNYNDSRGIVVYYGANDGLVRAVNGGPAGGDERWGLVFPEHFGQFKRLRDNTPSITVAGYPKPYFADGPVSAYVTYNNNIVDKAYIYVAMRRGGRFIYALDVSSPDAPALLWKRSNADTGFPEMGQSWSEVKVGRYRASSDPIAVFGAGYDATAEDTLPAGTPTMGRGLFVVNGRTGDLVRHFGTADGFTRPVVADPVAFDRNNDGFIDRIYVADTGANIFRIDTDDANPANWTVTRLAALGGTGTDERKFLYKPDVVLGTSYDMVLIGSGDREKPFDTTVQNRFYMIKDTNTGLAGGGTTITESMLTDVTGSLNPTVPSGTSGWMVRLTEPGQKVVGGATTVGGAVYFNTNHPVPPDPNSCTPNLGEARIYEVNYLTGGLPKGVTATSLYTVRPGGGYAPSPVPIIVIIDGRPVEAVAVGSRVVEPPSAPLGRRYRSFWYKERVR